jgi:DNA ligase 1
MKAFAALLESLAFEPSRLGKIALMRDYIARTPDPDRGYALAALCGALEFRAAKPAMLKALVAERVDETLFRLSYDYVGDLSETIALIWPVEGQAAMAAPRLADVIEVLTHSRKADIPGQLTLWLDGLDETGRWALLKLITGGLRVGVSAALAKQALAEWGEVEPAAIEDIWHALEPPYTALFDWLEGRSSKPQAGERLTFHSPMLAHPLDEAELDALNPAEFSAEWKWDGIRIEAAKRGGEAKLFSRSGDDISAAFPDLLAALDIEGVLDGELVILNPDGAVAPFSTLQQRLNRKSVSAKMLLSHPAHLMAYDLLFDGREDIRTLPFHARRARLEEKIARSTNGRIQLSPLIPFADWAELAAERLASADNPAIEGVMLKRKDSPYLAGRPKGHWYKWKREPHNLDCVLMYAQSGHGKRSSFYSDFTFGLWQGEGDARTLVPVGKAYFGFTDAELKQIDSFVRKNTLNRFGPVREVRHEADFGLVFEIAFEGVQESPRHKSGLAMRFPRISRIRWDKPPREADEVRALRALVRRGQEPA